MKSILTILSLMAITSTAAAGRLDGACSLVTVDMATNMLLAQPLVLNMERGPSITAESFGVSSEDGSVYARVKSNLESPLATMIIYVGEEKAKTELVKIPTEAQINVILGGRNYILSCDLKK